MDPSAVGNAILFVCCLVGTFIVSLYVLAYSAHCFLTVLQDTAAGLDEVVWPSEMIYDWLGRSVPIWGVFLLWLVPAGMLAHGLRHVWLPDDAAMRFLLLAVPGLWLLLPVGLLSALSGESGWLPVRWTILSQLARVLPSLVVFYISTALLIAAAAVPWYYALFRVQGVLLPVAAAAFATLILLYARLLGRLAWLGGRRDSPKRKPATAAPSARATSALDPWAFPPDLEAEIEAESQPKKKKKKKRAAAVEKETSEEVSEEASEETYELAGDGPVRRPAVVPLDGFNPIGVDLPPPEAEPQPDPDDPPADAAPPQGRSKIARELLQRPEPPPPPAFPLFSGVYTFPWYLCTLKAWLWLTLGGFIIGCGLRATLQHWPW
jgi:hypothetical protein